MNRKEIRREIDKLARMVEGWDALAEVPALERDLAMELLRHLYEAIRFCGEADGSVAGASEPAPGPASEAIPDTASETAPAEHAAVAAPADSPSVQEPQAPLPEREEDAEVFDTTEVLDLNELLSLGADSAMPEDAGFPEPSAAAAETSRPDRAESRMPDPVPDPVPVVGEPASTSVEEISASAPAPAPAVAPDLIPEPAPASVIVPEPAFEPVPEPISAVAPEPSDPESKPSPSSPTLFGLEETTRHRHKQRVIMSLYDTPADPEPPVRGTASSRGSEPSGMPFGLGEDPRSGNDAPSAVHSAGARSEMPGAAGRDFRMPEAEHHPVDAPAAAGAVLGDVINHDVQTLADTIAPPRDVASELRRQESVNDLRRAIGINDKFLLIRDLFDGDRLSYDRALDALNACDSLDDCMIYIAEHYAWNPESDGARLLMELLEHKFS